MTTPAVDRRKVARCPHCGALIVWGWDAGKRMPFDVVSMKATDTNHMLTCKQIAGWSRPQ